MGFRITFTNNNDVSDGHRVYRSQTSMEGVPVGDLPEPIAVLPPGIVEWEDGTVIEGETYFYMVSAYIGSGQAFSDEIEVIAEGEAPVIIKEAILSFTTSSLAQAPVNRVLFEEGLSGLLDLEGETLPWGVEYVSGSLNSPAFDVGPTYEGLPWPYNPIVDPEGDYTIRTYDDDPPVLFKLIGLNASKAYDVHFTGSRFSSGDRVSELYIAGGGKVSFDAYNNNALEGVAYAVVPSSEGEILLETSQSEGYWDYVSGLYIKEVAQPVVTNEAIFSFTTSSLAQAPVNRVLYSEGLTNALSIDAQPLPWGIEQVNGTPESTAFDTDVTYDGLPWPHSPIVDPQGDYTVRVNLSSNETTFSITGLDTEKQYTLRFTGSRYSDGSRQVRVSVAGQIKEVSAEYNDIREVIFRSLTPDAEGAVEFTIANFGAGGEWTYVSALYIQEVDPNGD